MNKKMVQNVFGWGVGLWLFGYILGFVFFAFVPSTILGWVIMPIGTAVTLWVLLKRISSTSLKNYFLIGVGWMIIAIVCDYFFLVELLKPADGYYKLDVYLYYLLTLLLPIVIGWWKKRKISM